MIDNLIKETTLIVAKDANAPAKKPIIITPISNPLVVKKDEFVSKNKVALTRLPSNDVAEENDEKISTNEEESKE